MEEERRLAYVAFTRAKDRLLLTDAEGVNYDNTLRWPSRFIFNAERENLEYVNELPPHLAAMALQHSGNEPAAEGKKGIYSPGDRVVYKIFGPGTVTALSDGGHSCKIDFDGLKTPRTIHSGADMKKE